MNTEYSTEDKQRLRQLLGEQKKILDLHYKASESLDFKLLQLLTTTTITTGFMYAFYISLIFEQPQTAALKTILLFVALCYLSHAAVVLYAARPRQMPFVPGDAQQRMHSDWLWDNYGASHAEETYLIQLIEDHIGTQTTPGAITVMERINSQKSNLLIVACALMLLTLMSLLGAGILWLL